MRPPGLGQAPTVHLGLEYEPWTGPDNTWSGPTYADYLAGVTGDATPEATGAEPVRAPVELRTPAIIAWALGLAVLYTLLNRSF